VGHLPLGNVANRVGAEEVASAPSCIEGAAEIAAQVVEGLGREIAALLVEKVLNEARREINQVTPAER
jgi:hypothetical protein